MLGLLGLKLRDDAVDRLHVVQERDRHARIAVPKLEHAPESSGIGLVVVLEVLEIAVFGRMGRLVRCRPIGGPVRQGEAGIVDLPRAGADEGHGAVL